MAGRAYIWQKARYSRTVGVLKVVLPLTALVALSLVFLLARTVDPRIAIATAEIDVEDRARDPRLSGARFAGVTDDGAALVIETETARSSPDGVMRLEVTDLSLRLEGQGGETFAVQSVHGVIDRGQGRFEMDGGLRIEASPGYRLSTEAAFGLLDTTSIEIPLPVEGQAPAGHVRAGWLRVQAESAGTTRYRLVFGGGVRFNYQPEP